MSEVIKISSVSYLNSAPFVFGLKKNLDPGLFKLELDIPSVCADKLLNGKVDIGLVPVAIIPQMKEHHIVSNYCIGAEGKVRSVMLYSNVPLPEIEIVLLDHQSRTSVLLAQVLARKFWKIAPIWKNAQAGFETAINGKTAGVVIGDRTFAMENKFPFVYDLSEEWQKFTGLPFVFACWVSNSIIPVNFLRVFNEALAYGLERKTEVVKQLVQLPAPPAVIEQYLNNYISYDLDEEKKKGMTRFLELAFSL